MKKTLCLLGFALTSALALGQNIKTKKNQILFDDKPIATFKAQKRWYTISDLNGQEILKIKPNVHVIDQNTREVYYEVTSPDGATYVSIYNKGDKSPISFEKKMLLDFTLAEYKLFTPEGLDTQVAEQILASNLDVKAIIMGKEKVIDDELNRINKIAENSKVDFNDKGEIVLNYKNKYGSLKRKKGSGTFDLIYEIYNADGKQIGIWESANNNGTLVFTNGTSVVIPAQKAKPESRASFDPVATAIVGYAIENKYIKL
ncbi:hypothetical protein K5I29_13290 [Flavobacterium agricola]|uniref:S9 family peptidase n=1 Tax=Flavobacterium agricola TaxID=2870839 RepID=A0ABY6LYH0_9FLAO|nr:hypothetical protein [Flavobacterium agricola]UYW01383.1 hypothetical protein K5I29_13290 [Flavobacterium agricola]